MLKSDDSGTGLSRAAVSWMTATAERRYCDEQGRVTPQHRQGHGKRGSKKSKPNLDLGQRRGLPRHLAQIGHGSVPRSLGQLASGADTQIAKEGRAERHKGGQAKVNAARKPTRVSREANEWRRGKGKERITGLGNGQGARGKG